MKNSDLEILICGAGAVGLGIAGGLLKNGAKLDLLARKHTEESLKKNGIHINGIFGEYAFPPDSFSVVSEDETPLSKEYDYIIICTKAYDVISTIKAVAARTSIKQTVFLLCQNGWGSAQNALEVIGDEKRIFNARVITGFQKTDPCSVKITVHADDILVGSIFFQGMERIMPLYKSLENGIVPTMLKPKIEPDILAKLLYNCCLNPLGALLRVPYGELPKTEFARNIMVDILTEAFQVFEASNMKTHWKTPEEYESLLYNELVPKTASHESSMLQDIRSGKQTEIDYLNGAIVKIAEHYGIPAPTNKMLSNLIRAKESLSTLKKYSHPRDDIWASNQNHYSSA